jgi:hypothetical protein
VPGAAATLANNENTEVRIPGESQHVRYEYIQVTFALKEAKDKTEIGQEKRRRCVNFYDGLVYLNTIKHKTIYS